MTHTASMEQTVLDSVDRNPSTNVRAVTTALKGSRNSLPRVLHDEALHPYTLQSVQTLLPTDHPARVLFVWWYLNQFYQDANFPSYVFFKDAAYFTGDCAFNQYNAYLWARENPHGVLKETKDGKISPPPGALKNSTT